MRVTRDKITTDEAPTTDLAVVEPESTELDAVEPTADYTPRYIPSRPVTDETVQAAMAELKARLNEPLDKALLKQRKGYGKDENGQPKMLDYLEWHTVTRQLNRIFGPSNWEWKVTDIKTFGEDPDSGVPCVVTATATLTITWPNDAITSYTNNGVEVVKRKEIWKNRQPTGEYEPRTWEAFEMAFKGAAHDAFKRAATALGEQFGLSLYAKEEETRTAKAVEVIDGDAATATTATRAASQRREAPRQQPVKSSADDYDPEEDDVAFCEDCNNEIRGYIHKTTGKVYTTQDLVNISKRSAGGRVLCYNCRNGVRR